MRFARCFVMSVIVSCAPLALAQDDAVELPAILTEPIPPRPVLPEDAAVEVEEIEAQIEDMRVAFLQGDRESLDEAIGLAERVHAIRVEHQTGWTDADGDAVEWWELGDARRRVLHLQSVEHLSQADRAIILRADRMKPEIMAAQYRGDFKTALEIVLEQQGLRTGLLEGTDPLMFTVLNDLGFEHYMLGDFQAAERNWRACLDLRSGVLEQDHPDTVTSLNNLGLLMKTTGRFEEAEDLLVRALIRGRRVLGDDHPDTLISINNLGTLIRAQGDFERARGYYLVALAGTRRVYGDNHEDTLSSVNNLAILRDAMGDLAGAERLHRDTLRGYRSLFGDDHPRTLSSLANLGSVLEAQGKIYEAEPYFRDALGGFHRAFGPQHPDTIISQGNLASLLESHGQIEEAEVLYLQALEAMKEVFGESHQLSLVTANNLALLYMAQGAYDEAEAISRRDVQLGSETNGMQHPQTLGAMSNLGRILLETGRVDEAATFVDQALASSRQASALSDPVLLGVLQNKAFILHAQGDHRGAEALLREALDIALRLRGETTGGGLGRTRAADRTDVRGLATSLACLLASRGESNEAWTIAEAGGSRALLDLLLGSERPLNSEDPASLASMADVAAARAHVVEAESRLAALQAQRSIVEDNPMQDGDQTDFVNRLDRQISDQQVVVDRARIASREANEYLAIVVGETLPVAHPRSAEETRESLPSGQVILRFVWSETQVWILTLTSESTHHALLAGDDRQVASLGELVHTCRAYLASPYTQASSTHVHDSCLALLDRLLPDQVRSQVTAATRVVVIPDGPLTDVAFAGIAFAANSPLSSTPFSYASSASVYLDRCQVERSRPDGFGTLLLTASPEFAEPDQPTPIGPQEGVLVMEVIPGTSAHDAGLRPRDVIVKYGDDSVLDYASLLETKEIERDRLDAGELAEDTSVPVTVWRDGTLVDTSMVPGSMGVYLDAGGPADGLAFMTARSTAVDVRMGRNSMLDSIRLHGGSLSPLPGTRAEVERIGDVATTAGWSPATLTGERATVANLEAAADSAHILHIATHGIVGSQDRPYDASLALTIPHTPTPDDIGFLRIDDMIPRWRGKLDQCDLVVLSACDTQRGIKSGTSMMALPWGFFYAGAPTVIASLWQVDDVATSLLMGRMYENLLGVYTEPRAIGDDAYAAGDEMSKIDALREAQQWLRELSWEERDELLDDEIYAEITRGVTRARPDTGDALSRKPYEHPYYWAAFVLIGDPG